MRFPWSKPNAADVKDFLRGLAEAVQVMEEVDNGTEAAAMSDQTTISTLAGDIPRLATGGPTKLAPTKVRLETEYEGVKVFAEWRAAPITETRSRIIAGQTRHLKGLSNNARPEATD